MDLVSIDHLLTTTRSVCKRLDLERPVEPEVVQECIDLATQAPDGGNLGLYHFLNIPDQITQGALLPVAYFTGDDFKPGKRIPGRERTYWETWEAAH